MPVARDPLNAYGTGQGAALHASRSTLDVPWPIWIVLATALALYAVSVVAATGFTIDDAYISARYAKNLASSGQLTWNVGEVPKTEGYSSPLWVLLLSGVFLLSDGLSFHLIQFMGIGIGVLALLMLFVLGRRLFISAWSAVLPPLFLSVSLPFVLWSVSGMENPLYIFLILLALYLAVDEEEKGLRYVTPVVLFLVFLTHTEGILFYGSVVAVRCVRYVLSSNARPADLKRFLVWNAIFLGCLAVYLLWKLTYYEAIFPLPVHVKKTAGFMGVHYVMEFVVAVAPFFVVALLGLRSEWDNRKIYLWATLSAYLFVIACSNPLMGWDFRLLAAAFPLVYLLAVWELDRIVAVERAHRRNALLFVLIACFLFVTIIKDPGDYADSLRNRAKASTQVLETVHVPLGKWLDEQPRDTGKNKVALADVGAVGFYFDSEVIDFYGLNDREIAHQGFSAERVLKRNPDYVVLNSKSDTTFQASDTICGGMSQKVFASESFREHYTFAKQFVSHKPFYSLWVYQRITDRSEE